MCRGVEAADPPADDARYVRVCAGASMVCMRVRVHACMHKCAARMRVHACMRDCFSSVCVFMTISHLCSAMATKRLCHEIFVCMAKVYPEDRESATASLGEVLHTLKNACVRKTEDDKKRMVEEKKRKAEEKKQLIQQKRHQQLELETRKKEVEESLKQLQDELESLAANTSSPDASEEDNNTSLAGGLGGEDMAAAKYMLDMHAKEQAAKGKDGGDKEGEHGGSKEGEHGGGKEGERGGGKEDEHEEAGEGEHGEGLEGELDLWHEEKNTGAGASSTRGGRAKLVAQITPITPKDVLGVAHTAAKASRCQQCYDAHSRCAWTYAKSNDKEERCDECIRKKCKCTPVPFKDTKATKRKQEGIESQDDQVDGESSSAVKKQKRSDRAEGEAARDTEAHEQIKWSEIVDNDEWKNVNPLAYTQAEPLVPSISCAQVTSSVVIPLAMTFRDFSSISTGLGNVMDEMWDTSMKKVVSPDNDASSSYSFTQLPPEHLWLKQAKNQNHYGAFVLGKIKNTQTEETSFLCVVDTPTHMEDLRLLAQRSPVIVEKATETLTNLWQTGEILVVSKEECNTAVKRMGERQRSFSKWVKSSVTQVRPVSHDVQNAHD